MGVQYTYSRSHSRVAFEIIIDNLAYNKDCQELSKYFRTLLSRSISLLSFTLFTAAQSIQSYSTLQENFLHKQFFNNIFTEYI